MSEQDHTAATRYAPIPSIVGYVAGDDGSIWSCWKNRGPKPRELAGERRTRLRPGSTPKGHQYVTIHLSRSKQVSRLVHRLVLETFTGPCPHGMEACHEDGNPANNRLDNLRWDTPVANNADKVRHGTLLFGDNHPSSKLTDAQVEAIRSKHRPGLNSYDRGNTAELATEYGVGKDTITAIARGAKRKHGG
jgi:hypothetical protein